MQHVLDQDERARLQDIAKHFDLSVEQVGAALLYCSRNFDRMKAEGRVRAGR